ncbi:MAG: efflux RND transporter periplasmic adaptor subunit [Bacteroidota bacterium]|nr:efflux RND transporter periplasmic adaptor subunit [Bacteroidota bacterium]
MLKNSNLFLIFSIIIIVSCNTKQEVVDNSINKDKDEIVLSTEQISNSGIELGLVQIKKVTSEVLANGIIDVPPQNLASVSTAMGGYVKKSNILPGTHVHKGEVLCELENLDFIQMQQDYLIAKNKLELAELELKRQSELAQVNVNSRRELQISTSEYNINKASVNALEQKLKILGINIIDLIQGNIAPRVIIKSPITGDVKKVHITLGKYINNSDPLFDIVDNSHMHLELSVFEKDILKIEKNELIRFKVPAVSEEEFTGKVYLVGKTFDPISRTILVHGHMDNEDKKKLFPGMYVTAKIETSNYQTKVIPEDALIRQDGKNYIYLSKRIRFDSIRFRQIPVQIGTIANGYAEIKTILIDTIVTKGAYYIQSEMNKSED